MYGKGDGQSQNYQLSWGSGSDNRASVVIGANFVKQEPVSSGDREISQFPTPGATACDAGCSSGTPLGRFIVLGQDLTLIAPVLGRPPVLADYRPWAGASDRFNFAPFNFIQTPLKRYGLFANFRYEVADDINFSAKAMWNRQVEKGGAHSAVHIRAGRRRANPSTESRSTQPIRSIRSVSRLSPVSIS